ncbi:MAG: TonB-dependent receptor [Burkholderiales bacterium]|nr:TonB-dependent receptor [Burkholderiales bacterium]MDE1926991.1 TonB-dependent receptor [Burkholderiales bacterium]
MPYSPRPLTALALATQALLFTYAAQAQDPAPPDAKTAQATGAASGAAATGAAQAATESDANITQIVITGAARPQRRFDASYAVNSLPASAIDKLAPRTYSDLLATVPGIQVESSGGEAQEITRVRGLPGDRFGFVVLQDGMPLYHDIDGVFFNSGDGMNRYDLMTERVEIVRGGPSPIYASSAAAIANNITVSGHAQPRGAGQITLGDGGLYRMDAYQSGPLNSDTYYAIGGFLRQNQGLRDNGFPTDQGGQIRANIKHVFANGWVKASVQLLDDHNVFDLPIPTNIPPNAGSAAYPTVNPGASLDPYLGYFTGTMNTPALRHVNINYYDNGVLKSQARDLANGRHMQFGNIGLQYQGNFDDTTVSFKSSMTRGKLGFDAFYSTSNPVDANTFAASQLGWAQGAFPGASSVGYAIGGTNGATPYNPYNDSGLVIQGQYRANDTTFYSIDNDLSATHTFETGLGTHDVKVGAYTSFWGTNYFYASQDYLTQVLSQPQTLDLIAYSAAGKALGSVTQNGALHDTTGVFAGQMDAKLLALYLNDTWAITSRLTLDAGVRQEHMNYSGYDLNSSAQPLPGPTRAATYARGFDGTSTAISLSPKASNWTVGLNYDFANHLGAYARASHLEVPAELSSFLTTTPTANPLAFLATHANQYEIGLKAVFDRSYVYLTAYYTDFNPLNASFVAFNPQTGANTNISFFGKAIDKGLEADGRLSLGRMFAVDGSFTLADPQYRDFNSVTGASAAAIYGKQLVREPKIYGHIRPNVDLRIGDATGLNLYLNYQYTGKRYVDVLNTTSLPAYGTIGAGAILTQGSWMLQVVGENLTNAHGLTEGNTRTDGISGQGTPVAIYGRPIYGRNWRVMLKKSW